MIYHQEMNESPAARLFATSHNFRDSYSVTWPASRDEEARNALRALKIRALKCYPIRSEKLGEWSPLRQFGEDGFSCLISGSAIGKLIDNDLCAHEVLLD